MSSTEEAPASSPPSSENILQKAGQVVRSAVDKTGELHARCCRHDGQVLRKPFEASEETTTPTAVDDPNKTSATMIDDRVKTTVRRRSIFLSE